MRVEYIGKSVADLNVSIRNGPPIQRGFSHGVRFRKDAPDSIFMENVVSIDASREDSADILVLEFDDCDELIVVVVNQRCLQNCRLVKWLERAISVNPDGPSSVLLFVPEAKPNEKGAARNLGKKIRHIWAEARSYYPPLVD